MVLRDMTMRAVPAAPMQSRVSAMLGVCVLLVLPLLVLPRDSRATERIEYYDVEVEVAADGGLDIVETITVVAEGARIRRGIYRDFPTRYRDRHGNRVVVGFDVVDVQRNGKPEPWFTESVSNGVRVNTGNDDFLPVPQRHTFRLHYRTTRQVGFFEGHDELYWNAIGTGWEFPIARGTVEVRLPEPVPVGDMHVEGYTGRQGATAQDYRAWVAAPGVARFETTDSLAPGEGFTIVVTFPKGVVSEPSAAMEAGWFLRDNLGAGLALLGLAGVLAFYLLRWRRHGRDPSPGVIFPHYEPPTGFSPGLLRQVWKMSYGSRCFAADLVALATRGLVQIERDPGLLQDSWTLQRTAVAAPDDLPPSQGALLQKLFSGGSRVELHKRNHAVIGGARRAHSSALEAAAQPRFYVSNLGTAAIGWLLSGALVFGAFMLSRGHGVPVIIAVAVLLAAINIVFVLLMRRPTAEGRQLLDRIEGLRLYLGVAERDELRAAPGPDAQQEPRLDAERYQQLLPYALALEVEDAWTGRFITAVGAAAAAETASHIAWYSGDGSLADLGDVSRALGSSLSGSIASSASPPGSSSGSGGGGSSGGGGGGGGGGGR